MSILHHARLAAPRAILACRASPSRHLWLWPTRKPKEIEHSKEHEPEVPAQENAGGKPCESKIIHLKKLDLPAREVLEHKQDVAKERDELSHSDSGTIKTKTKINNTNTNTKGTGKRPSARLSECPAIYDPDDLDLGSRQRQETFYQRQLPWFLGGGPF